MQRTHGLQSSQKRQCNESLHRPDMHVESNSHIYMHEIHEITFFSIIENNSSCQGQAIVNQIGECSQPFGQLGLRPEVHPSGASVGLGFDKSMTQLVTSQGVFERENSNWHWA